jgi:hypothetical protein
MDGEAVTQMARFRNGPCLALATLGGLLALLAVVHVGQGIALIIEPGEAMYGEAVVYNVAARMLRGEQLYQPLDRPPYTVAAYTPLYYWLAAGLQATVGPGFGPGRVLSFLAGLTTVSLVAYLAARRLRDARAGVFAALLYLGLGVPVTIWSAFYRVDMLGVALSLGSIAILVGGMTTRRLILAAALAGLAVLTKQTSVAAGLAGFIWLWRQDRSKAAFFATIGSTIIVTTCIALEIATGAFVANAVIANVNPFSVDALVSNLAILAVFQAAAITVTGLHLWDRARTRPEPEDELLTYFWATSLLPLAGLAKVGSNHNYWIELAAASAVLATIGVWTRLAQYQAGLSRGAAILPIVLLGVNAAIITPLIGSSARPLTDILRLRPSRSQEFGALVERVRSEPGEIMANPLDVVVLAGRPVLLEPYIFNILEVEEAWDSGPLVRRICAGEVSLLVLDYPLERPGPEYHGYAHWPASIVATLRETMVLETSQASRFLYVFRGGGSSPRCRSAGLWPTRPPIDGGASGSVGMLVAMPAPLTRSSPAPHRGGTATNTGRGSRAGARG